MDSLTLFFNNMEKKDAVPASAMSAFRSLKASAEAPLHFSGFFGKTTQNASFFYLHC
jgi:hypothetical protein